MTTAPQPPGLNSGMPERPESYHPGEDAQYREQDNLSSGQQGYQDHTTLINVGQAAVAAAWLTPEEREVVGALPADSALLVIRTGQGVGSRFLVDSDVVVVGRHPSADIFLDDVTVSRRHAEFRRHDGQFSVHDLGSLNGIFHMGQRVDSAVIFDGSEIQIGKFHLNFFTSRSRPLLEGLD